MRDQLRNRDIYDDQCVVHCTDKEKDLDAIIMDFKLEKYMNVVIGKELRVNMKFVPRHKIYVGSAHGLEFTTKGPKKLN